MSGDVIAAVSRGVMATLVDGTIRVKIDIEPADAALAFQMLGMPGSPVAIAALAIGAPPESRGEIKPDIPPPPKGGALARLAGVWCNLPTFADWLADEYTEEMGSALAICEGDIHEAAAEVVRGLCGIQSRAELDNDPVAERLFNDRIRTPFMAHMEGRPE